MTDFNKKSAEDLTKIVGEKKEELRTLRFNLAGAANKNTKAALLARKEVARALTALNARKSANA